MKSTSVVAAALLLSTTALVHAAPNVQRRTEILPVETENVWVQNPADPLVSRTIYLNRCQGGCLIRQGQENAAANTSSIQISGQANYTEFSYGDDKWDQLVQCVRETYAPFNIKIVEDRPASGTYWMHVVAGTSTQFGFDQNDGVLGVSPGTFQCPSPLLNNTITFTFVNDQFIDDDVNEWCWIVAQETAHSFGLDHEALALDPMTYIGLGQLPTPRHDFKDENGACGAFQSGDQGCYCPSIPQQNSYQSILGIFGGACADDDACTEFGDGFVCIDGDCVAGPDVDGGLGTECADATECESGVCTESTNSGSYCTETCEGSDSCPAGFECLDGANVCWPSDGGGDGGCCSTGGGAPSGAILLGFAVGLAVLRRRRDRV